jgi:glutamate 5-kinase
MMSKMNRIVVKVGTSTLTGGTPRLNLPRITSLALQMSSMMDSGFQAILVSSGAIAAGRERLEFPELTKSIPIKQMLAAVGQPRLMNVYEQLFGIYGRQVAQILLTREDISERRRYLNARNTLEALLNQGVLPVINENDSIATDEIKIGDNDTLSALVANLIEADLLVLLTDQEGLYTSDPIRDKNAVLIEEISTPDIPEDVWAAAGGSRNGLGTGGMVTKLEAADIARRSGTRVVIARGDLPDVLTKLAAGEKLGTCFLPVTDTLESRKRFMLAGAIPRVSIRIDDGAIKALRGGGSLLPVGITHVQGNFDRGDIIKVKTNEGKDCAVGLANYASEDIQRIMGSRSSEIEHLLGYAYGEEVIHHNNMTVLGS